MVLSDYTLLTPQASAPPQYTTLGATPQPMYPNLPTGTQAQTQTPQQMIGQLFNPFASGTNPFTAAQNPITGQPEAATHSEVIGNSSAAGSTGQQFTNYKVTYFAPVNDEEVHTECFNCCEDCCEDCCENWMLNCCLDCSTVTYSLLGGANTNAATATAAETTGYTQLGTGSTNLGATGLIWDNGLTSLTKK